MVSVQAVVVPLRRAAERLETVGGHAAALSTAALDEIGPFLRAALALTRGMKSGTTYLMKQLDQRIMQGRFATHGGSEHD